MTKTKEHRKQELLVAVLGDALIDTRDEADRHFEAKRRTAGEHMHERARRQALAQELRRTRAICRDAAQELHRLRNADSTTSVVATFDHLCELLMEAGRDDST